MVRSADGTWSYFVKRFDRVGHNGKVAVEDFAQLSGRTRDTKYDFSMERLVNLLDAYCTFPAIEKVKLLKRSLFNFLVGNEDMHLKNHSLITRQGKVELAPAYDFLSSTVAYLALGTRPDTIMETALPLGGKRRGLTRRSWIAYFGTRVPGASRQGHRQSPGGVGGSRSRVAADTSHGVVAARERSR